MNIIKFNLDELENQNTGFSYYLLGRSYDLEENGAIQDYTKALEYYLKGLNIDYPLCIYSLGISYELGLGEVLSIDKNKSKELLNTAYPKIIKLINNPNISDTERIYAKFVTGAYYYFGLGNIEKDYNKAFQIIKECADKGHIAAIYDLGANFYFNGNGTDINYDLADYYLNLAKENGLKRAIDLYDARSKTKKNGGKIMSKINLNELVIRICNSDDVKDIYDIQKIVINSFKENEKGYFLPFTEEWYLRIVNNPLKDGEIYGAFYKNKMIAWIFLSVSTRMEQIKSFIPDINGKCADIDGVIVLPEYRGNGLQKILVNYLEKKAQEKGINNVVAEVTFENHYSLKNLQDLGYEIKTWYQKDENIKRHILLKKI